MTRIETSLACVAVVCLLGSVAYGENWPGWRGDGSGVSSESGVPIEWGPDKNLLWKTRIGGDGISSPIVWEDKVFVTAAVDGTAARASHAAIAGLVSGLLLLALVSVRLRRSPGGGKTGEMQAGPRLWVRMARAIDLVATTGATAVLAVGLAALLFAGDVVTTPDDTERMWLVSGLTVLFGIVAAVGWLPRASSWRLVGMGVLLAAAAHLHLNSPYELSDPPVSLSKLLIITAPLVAAATWYAVSHPFFRRLGADRQRRRRVVWTFAGPGALVAAVALSFLLLNYVQPRRGLLRQVVCLSFDTGEILWRSTAFLAPAEKKYRPNSHATPTPVTNGEHVVAAFGPGLVAMDFRGEVKWRMMEPLFAEHAYMGAGSSPILYGDKVLYAFFPEGPDSHGDDAAGTAERARHAYLVALAMRDGEEVWRTTPPAGHDSYNTPLVIRHAVQPAIVLATWERVAAFEPTRGTRLWECAIPIPQVVPSIVADEAAAYVMGGAQGRKGVVAIRLNGNGDVTDTHVVWKTNRGPSECSSPVLYDGLLYWVTLNGIATCMEAETGKQVWKKRLGGGCLGSPVACAGAIYFPLESGEIVVIRAGRAFEELARNDIGEVCRASPAISDHRLLIRGVEHLFCIGSRSAP